MVRSPGARGLAPEAGTKSWAAGSQKPEAGVAAWRARSQAGCSRSWESGVEEAERSEGLELCTAKEASRAASGGAPGAVLEKAGSGGVAMRCSHTSRPPFKELLPGPGAEGGRGREGVVVNEACAGARRHGLGSKPGRTEKSTGRSK